MKSKHIVVLLLTLMFVQAFTSSLQKARDIDEIGFHLQAGYQMLTTGKWVTGIDNPPLTGTLSAIPLLFVNDKNRFNNFDRGSAEDYIYEKKPIFPRNVLLVSRIITMLFMLALGYTIFLWARDLYGAKAGLFALFLYTFSPNILALGEYVRPDIPSAFFMFLSFYTLWRYARHPTKKNLVIASLTFGLAQITKLFSILLIPAFVFYAILIYYFKDFNPDFFINIRNKKAKKFSDLVFSLVIIFSVGLFTINLAYLFDGSFMPLSKYNKGEFASTTFKNLYDNWLVNWIPIPLPRQYVMGHDYGQFLAKDEERGYFYWGNIGRGFDFKSYYLGYLLIKTPIALFIFLALSFFYSRRIQHIDIVLFFFMGLLLFLLTFFSQVRLGYRHIIIFYPIFFLWCGGIFKNGIPKNKIILGLVTLSSLWYLASSLLIFPHHMAYYNEFIGGPKNAYKYGIDSNLDMEQDLEEVKKYMKNSNEKILIDPGCTVFTGKVAIPANSLQFQKWVCYQWLKQNFEPIDYIGYSWLVYDVKGIWQKTDNGYIFTKTS